jgi:hypothetical protein
MSRRPARFTREELRRAVETAKAAGDDWAVEILPNDTIRLRRAEKISGGSSQFDEEEVIRLC